MLQDGIGVDFKNDMEQRDLIKDQIEQLGKVLGKILSDFLGMKSNNNAALGIEVSNERLHSQLDINIEELITLNKKELAELVKNKSLMWNHLETLSEYLKEVGIAKTENNKIEAQLYLEKAIELLDIADEASKTTSFSRIIMENEIKDLLKQTLSNN